MWSAPDEPEIKLAILVAMSAMFVLALTIPEAFDDAGAGWTGRSCSPLCYLLVRVLPLRHVHDRRAGGRRSARPAAAVRAQRGRQHHRAAGRVAVQRLGPDGLWALALVVDYVGTALGGAAGWRLPAPGHFSERHGLITIVALGESIVAIGVGVAELPISLADRGRLRARPDAGLGDVVGLLRRQRPARRARPGPGAESRPGRGWAATRSPSPTSR